MSSWADKFARKTAALDASVLINLLAMECSSELLRTLGCCGIVPQVRSEMKRCPLTRKPLGDRWKAPPLSLLEDWQLDEDDYELYLEFHVDARLGKGEAASLAYACRRRHGLLCDDTAVPLVVERRCLDVPILTTLDVLRMCVDTAVLPSAVARAAIISGLRHSKMATPEGHEAWLQELQVDPSVYRGRAAIEPVRNDSELASSQGALDFEGE